MTAKGSSNGGDQERDALIVQGCRRGDEEALVALMQAYGRSVAKLVRGIVTTDPIAQDGAIQDTFFKAFRKIDQFQDGTSLRVWLLTIARNTAYDHLRRESVARVTPVDIAEIQEPVSSLPGPVEDFHRKEDRGRVLSALKELPTKLSEVVYLRFFEELTWDAISRVTGIPEATARARMNGALRRLKSALARAA